jgi:hypothetical protein
MSLDGHGHEDLPGGSSARFPRANPAEKRLVHLHDAGQPIPARPHPRHAQPVHDGPYCLIGTEAEEAMERERCNTVLRGGHGPGHRKPHGQWRARPVEDRPRGDRHAAMAGFAPMPAVLQTRTTAATARAHEALRPSPPSQVVQARAVVREPPAPLGVVAREIATRDEDGGRLLGGGGHRYILYLPQ